MSEQKLAVTLDAAETIFRQYMRLVLDGRLPVIETFSRYGARHIRVTWTGYDDVSSFSGDIEETAPPGDPLHFHREFTSLATSIISHLQHQLDSEAQAMGSSEPEKTWVNPGRGSYYCRQC